MANILQHQKYVALKALRADCYGGHHDIFEREILSKILEVSRHSSHQCRNYVSHLLEQFTHTGPNGDHACLAFDVLGHHLDFQIAKYEDGKLPVRAVKTIARQLLLALDFLHRECGIIHTDLKPTNILLELENKSRTIAHYLSEVPARTDSQRGVTTPLREAIPTSLVSETKSLHVRLIDFGVEKGNRAAHFFDKQGNLLRIPDLRPTCLERLVNGTTKPFLKPIDMPEAEVPIFVDFLEGVIEIDPGSRKPAAELLQHEWIHGPDVIVRFATLGRAILRREKAETEVAAMKYISHTSSIPVPEVFGSRICWASPYIVMSFLKGVPLSQILKDPSTKERPVLNPQISDWSLKRAYHEMAAIMLELSKYRFDSIGSLGGDETGFFIARRPLTFNMNELMASANLPEEVFPSHTFRSATDYFQALATQHLFHLRLQQRNAVIDEDDCRKKFNARCLFLNIAKNLCVEYPEGPFRLYCDDFRPSNVLIDLDTLRVSGVIDWEF
ncbi:hypothetical protein ANOM_002487 [Aspergillus nomiae NRRL 13137]|uniref:non-specific serine/threonine protein kinase n=1 Tax=Aspergillus nomiae NRRL (strain ATCC 15546 / NRRL 13137 / CBS 260.88 / M93) TaxID=1509407 RepID=A0A0L1JAN9_ASPN3|nr:uncharacterized protein ANOM_002487 [Aspergillus nomiae NRRL 13137]KNG88819.1 hypothetical protein ANOM_002487 [Aspergillus nomiae NRRL 13137]